VSKERKSTVMLGKHNHHMKLKLGGHIDVGRLNYDYKKLIAEMKKKISISTYRILFPNRHKSNQKMEGGCMHFNLRSFIFRYVIFRRL
jgi:hypothetical protein